jgi:hypothetical protein
LNVIATSKGQVMGALWYEVAAFAEEIADDDEDDSHTKQEEQQQQQQPRKVDKADCNAGAVLTPFTHHITGRPLT